jgi:hypothetical protein
MKPKLTRAVAGRLLWLIFCLALTSCQSRDTPERPTIEFSKIPPAAQGGKEKMDTIAGRVTGARPDQKIVVYVRSGAWWVQPSVENPFISIGQDSTWSTPTHLGYEYAALLVNPDFHPSPTVDIVPTESGPIARVAVVKGTGAPILAPTKPLKFSGYDWDVRTIASDRGGTSNLYSGDNAWTDSNGALHLRIYKKGDQWSCAEVVLNRSLGYGTYSIVVRDTAHLEPAAVLSMTTFDEWAGEQHYREMDVEIGRWGDADNKNNAQYIVEPYYHPGNVAAFAAPSGTLTHSMGWESGRVRFKTFRGGPAGAGQPVVYEHEFTSGVPTAGQERIHLFFFVVGSSKNPMQHDSEVVIDKFEYLP